MSQRAVESDDDTSDDDYVPGGADCAQLSEVESDGDPEDDNNDSEDECSGKRTKRKSKTKTKKSKKAKTEVEEEEEVEEKPKVLGEEEQKKKTDSLWADFLKDTDFKPKPVTTTETKPTSTSTTKKKISEEKPKESTPVIFEFAGETVHIPQKNVSSEKQGTSQVTPTPTLSKFPSKKIGGMSSLLSQIGKKQKISTLEKSKLDWDRFKEQEDITDELRSFNKGKNGYLERQDFLQRADLRQFEIEKKARATQRSHRLN